ncbi:MAG: 30S ribosomal protein S8 [bacterium]|nr:30S ribosomal protein S8 [bacterium]
MDKISNIITKIQNANKAGKQSVFIPASNLNESILGLMKRNGFISDFSRKEKSREIKVVLAYDGGLPKIEGVRRVSKPSQRVYIRASDIRRVKQGYGKVAVSTPRGIMTGEDARKERLGGEPLFEIW